MKIIDITDKYLKYIADEISLTDYESSRPELFEQYNRFWCEDDRPYPTLKPEELRINRDFILNTLPYIEHKFIEAGFALNDIDVVLFVGKGTSNGHAYEHDGRFIVWLPVELYSSTAMVRIFVTHEIVHALHYRANPEFRFASKADATDFARQLITEGIATFLTAEILGVPPAEALWADYLPQQKAEMWMKTCEENRPGLIDYCIERISSGEPDPVFFRADNPDSIYEFRAGYYVGTILMRELSAGENLSFVQILKMDKATIIAKIRSIG